MALSSGDGFKSDLVELGRQICSRVYIQKPWRWEVRGNFPDFVKRLCLGAAVSKETAYKNRKHNNRWMSIASLCVQINY